MRITMLATTAAIALIATVGSVSAGQLTTLNGVKAVPMSSAELSAVKGMDHHFFVITPHATPNTIETNIGSMANPVTGFVLDPAADTATGPLATDGRFGTDFNHDGDEANFVDITLTQNAAPSYLGFRQASCNGVIRVAGFANC